MTGRIALGVDPGYRDTGIGVIAEAPGTVTPTLLANLTVHREDSAKAGQSLTSDVYLDDVATALLVVLQMHHVTVAGVEDVVAPTPHMGVTNPTGIIGTALTAGDVRRLLRSELSAHRVHMVRPAKNGSHPAGCYPPELLDRGGLVRPAGSRRHERSAFDVAREALRGAA
jgi:Holliday junction resolvasome RuvABC endonuclease subunit